MELEELKTLYTLAFNQYNNIINVTSYFEQRLHYFIGLFSFYISTISIVLLQFVLKSGWVSKHHNIWWIIYFISIGVLSFIIIDFIIIIYFYRSKRKYTVNIDIIMQKSDNEGLPTALKYHIEELNICTWYNFKSYEKRSNLFNISKKLFFVLINFIVLGLFSLLLFN